MSDTITLTKKKDFTKPEFKASRAANATVRKIHVLLDKFGKEIKESKSKKMNMGGVMKNRGGMFKGTY